MRLAEIIAKLQCVISARDKSVVFVVVLVIVLDSIFTSQYVCYVEKCQKVYPYKSLFLNLLLFEISSSIVTGLYLFISTPTFIALSFSLIVQILNFLFYYVYVLAHAKLLVPNYPMKA